MLEKYFGFFDLKDEVSIIDSLLEHSRIDEEELFLLSNIIESLLIEDRNSIEDFFYKIKKINTDSHRIFEHISEQIIQSDLGFQKQSDLLRIFQRIEKVSYSIVTTSNALVVLSRISNSFHMELVQYLKKMIAIITEMHAEFKNALSQYQQNKHNIITIIHRIEELDDSITDIHSNAIQSLYKLGNNNKLSIGTFACFEKIFNLMERLPHHIEESATSLEWLLINPEK